MPATLDVNHSKLQLVFGQQQLRRMGVTVTACRFTCTKSFATAYILWAIDSLEYLRDIVYSNDYPVIIIMDYIWVMLRQDLCLICLHIMTVCWCFTEPLLALLQFA